jgi:hypothetical protein
MGPGRNTVAETYDNRCKPFLNWQSRFHGCIETRQRSLVNNAIFRQKKLLPGILLGVKAHTQHWCPSSDHRSRLSLRKTCFVRWHLSPPCRQWPPRTQAPTLHRLSPGECLEEHHIWVSGRPLLPVDQPYSTYQPIMQNVGRSLKQLCPAG